MTSTWSGNPPPDQKYADERDPSKRFENCVAASGVTLANAATFGAFSTDDAEVQKLRKATGDVSGGETLRDLQRGLKARYKLTAFLSNQWTAIANACRGEGWAAVVGYELSLPVRLRTQGSQVFHCVVLAPPTAGSLWRLIDPMDTSGPGGHPTGRGITEAEAKVFCASGSFASLVLTEGSDAPTHWEVVVKAATRFSVWDHRAGGKWFSKAAFSLRGFRARCDAPVTRPDIRGATRKLVGVTSGDHAGDYLDVGKNSRVTAAQVKGR